MGQRGNNFFHMVAAVTALPPIDINGATVNGSAIVEPWQQGRQVVFVLQGGVFAATTDLSFAVQGLRRDDGTTWEDLLDGSGNPLVLEGADYDDAGPLEGGELLGTLPLDDVDSTTYEAIRISGTNANAVSALVAVAGLIFDTYSHPTGQTDQIFPLMRP